MSSALRILGEENEGEGLFGLSTADIQGLGVENSHFFELAGPWRTLRMCVT
jgi:hypothetical protein